MLNWTVKRLPIYGSLGIVMFLSGCATIANLNGSPTTLMQMPGLQKPDYFGGIKRHLDAKFGIGSVGDGGLFVMADTPFTMVGDVVSLPAVHLIRSNDKKMRQWGEAMELFSVTDADSFASE